MFAEFGGVEMRHEVIEMAIEIESLLKEAGGLGSGMRELSNSIDGKLTDTVRKNLRYIARIRNKAAHEKIFNEHVDQYKKAAESVRSHLWLIIQSGSDEKKANLAAKPVRIFHRINTIPSLEAYLDLPLEGNITQETMNRNVERAKQPIEERDISKQVEVVSMPVLPQSNTMKVTKIIAGAGALLALTILQFR